MLLAGFAVERFLAPGAPAPIVVDDTLFPRSGRRVFAAGYHFDQDQRTGRLVRFVKAVCALPG